MSVGYDRKATPEIVYERAIGPWECFRVCGADIDALDRLMFRGELREFFLKAQIEHFVGDNWRRPYGLPPNPGRKDDFVVIAQADIESFRYGFTITGFSPELAA